jgi:hypothetical protein
MTHAAIVQLLFKKSAPFLELIDRAIPEATTANEYAFISDEWFRQWMNSSEFSVEKFNHVIATELLEKAHLASVTAIMRAQRWANATCRMYDDANFLGFAAAFRGLLESAGDTVDGLLQVPYTLALNRRMLLLCLATKQETLISAASLENLLDHFVHAKWRKRADTGIRAKDTIAYVRTLASVIPNVEPLYHRLCGIMHPSSDSIEYFNEPLESGRFKVSAHRDKQAIQAVLHDHPEALQDIFMMHSNPPVLTLKVLHAFKIHPLIKSLKQFDYKLVKGGAEIERLLKN